MTQTVQQTRISLKNLKVADFASEETLCFVATVLFDGQPIAEAKNEGCGGCTFLYPLKGAGERLTEAEAFAKSLPPVDLEYHASDKVHKTTIEVTLDFLVDHIAGQMHEDRKIRTAFNRDIANKVLFIKNNSLKYLKRVKLKTVADKKALFKMLREENGAEIILAELPQNEAFALWKKHAVDGETS